MTAGWQMYNGKLDFLSQSLTGSLTDAYLLIEDYNNQIAAAKKSKSASYLAALDMSRLKEKLEKAQQGLDSWSSANSEAEKAEPKTPGLFG